MKIQEFSKLIRQSARTVQKRISDGDIQAKLVEQKGVWGGFKYWDISDKWIKKLLSGKHDKW
jgi:hypothetical protein